MSFSCGLINVKIPVLALGISNGKHCYRPNKLIVQSVSKPGFPEPETQVFWLFSTTQTPFFFHLPNPGI